MKQPPQLDEALIAVTPEKRFSPRTIEDATVTKVGRKYFSVRIKGSHREEEFCLARWERKGENMHCNFPMLLFRSMVEMEDHFELIDLAEKLSKRLQYQSDWRKLDVEVLRQIEKLTSVKQ